MKLERKTVDALQAAISRRSWSDVEVVANELRDKLEAKENAERIAAYSRANTPSPCCGGA